jgi:TatD DNase family protein
MKLIDMHTHTNYKSENVISLCDRIDFIGLHPWIINIEKTDEDLLKLDNQFNSKVPLMIGETGLDKLKCSIDLKIQMDVFYWHLEKAKKLNRPLVLHVLKAHNEVLNILKEMKFEGTFLIHGYSGNHFEIKNYLKYNSFFSFGKYLLKDGSKAQKSILHVPLDRLFLETDDDKNLNIKDVYLKAERLLGVNNLEKQIQNNFLRFFGQANDVCPSDFINNFRMNSSR